MKSRILAAVMCLSTFAGCTSSPVKYDLEKEARIRVFHDVGVYMYPNKTCYSEDKSEAIHASAGGFSMLVPNQKIGMPPSENMGRSYHEFLIRAGEPLTLEMHYAVQMTTPGQKITNSCGPIGATFVPQAGKDYEAAMIFNGGYCKVGVSELQAVPSKPSKPIPITLVPAGACR